MKKSYCLFFLLCCAIAVSAQTSFKVLDYQFTIFYDDSGGNKADWLEEQIERTNLCELTTPTQVRDKGLLLSIFNEKNHLEIRHIPTNTVVTIEKKPALPEKNISKSTHTVYTIDSTINCTNSLTAIIDSSYFNNEVREDDNSIDFKELNKYLTLLLAEAVNNRFSLMGMDSSRNEAEIRMIASALKNSNKFYKSCSSPKIQDFMTKRHNASKDLISQIRKICAINLILVSDSEQELMYNYVRDSVQGLNTTAVEITPIIIKYFKLKQAQTPNFMYNSVSLYAKQFLPLVTK